MLCVGAVSRGSPEGSQLGRCSWVKWGKEENEYGTSVMVVLCRTTKRTDYVIQIENRVGVTLEYEYAHLSMRRSVSL